MVGKHPSNGMDVSEGPGFLCHFSHCVSILHINANSMLHR